MSETSGKTLVLVRHAKAAHNAPTDLERPLSSKGRAMAEDLAKVLSRYLGGELDLLLVSPAARARQTARAVQERIRPAETRVEPEIYHDGPQGILSLLAPLPESVRTVVVVGHEPTVSILAHTLHDAADEMASTVSFGVPTATALVLEVPGSWAGLEPQGAHLAEILTAAR